MEQYFMSEIKANDKRNQEKLVNLLVQENITKDANLDYTIGMFDEDYNLIATGSTFANTLRCFAVDSAHQGEGLLNKVISHLIEHQMERGITHLFLYTKCDKKQFFQDLGFYEIALVENKVVFMENRRNGFQGFLDKLAATKREGTSSALVMNCNPFTLGHQYLVEQASQVSDTVHLFVVSEDVSFFPFADRFELVKQGCQHLDNVIFHETDSYMISSAVFPSYFLQDEEDVIRSHGRLDIELFSQIAQSVGVTVRFVGDEPYSKVTNIYNQIMEEELPHYGIDLKIIPRKQAANEIISASHVRQLLHDGKLEEVRKFVPETTFAYFQTEKGKKVIEHIQKEENVVHY